MKQIFFVLLFFTFNVLLAQEQITSPFLKSTKFSSELLGNEFCQKWLFSGSKWCFLEKEISMYINPVAEGVLKNDDENSDNNFDNSDRLNKLILEISNNIKDRKIDISDNKFVLIFIPAGSYTFTKQINILMENYPIISDIKDIFCYFYNSADKPPGKGTGEYASNFSKYENVFNLIFISLIKFLINLKVN